MISPYMQRVFLTQARKRFDLDADNANVWLGGNGKDPATSLFTQGLLTVVSHRASIHLDGQTGSITMRSAAQVRLMRLEGNTGDITLYAKESSSPRRANDSSGR